jgi:proteasome assembly chaperone (PAC2) family protein
VCAFKGWNDAADAASTALTFVGSSLKAKRFAHVDPQEFFDFQTTRPQIRLVEGRAREISWPGVELYEAQVPGAPRDLVLMSGVEPSLRWRDFCTVILDLAEALDVQLLVTLGALLADVPHTRDTPITGLASDDALVERLGLTDANYEGPTGIVGVLHTECADRGLPSASLWAAVPHYVAAAPNPKAALALVRTLEGLSGVSVEAAGLERAVGEYERQVELAVAADPEVQAFVERLERESGDAPPAFDPSKLPSGDALARDIQRFLRQRGSDDT